MTKIEWVINPDGSQGKTWNPVTGCSKVSSGCKNCFAEVMANRLKAMGKSEYQDVVDEQGHWTGRVTLVPARLDEPLRWRKPRRVFVNSMSDLFHPDVPEEFIVKIFARMTGLTEHTFQVLTKRPERMHDFINRRVPYIADWPNIQLGTSVENQRAADDRIPWLLKTPAAVRFLSCEPLLGPIDLHAWNQSAFRDGPQISWVIVGGESGPNARLMEEEWAISLVRQCQEAGVPVFVKQMGTAWAKRHAGYRDPKGADMRWWPPELQVREMP